MVFPNRVRDDKYSDNKKKLLDYKLDLYILREENGEILHNELTNDETMQLIELEKLRYLRNISVILQLASVTAILVGVFWSVYGYFR